MSRPADWTPLATGDPVPGDPVEVALAGRRLRQVADQISADVSWLRSLCTARFWDTGAGQAFHCQVDDAAAKLAQARDLYLAASEALGSSLDGPGYAAALYQAQSLSLRALTKAQQSRYNASALEYRTAKGWLAEATALRDEAAARAAALIRAATGADGLQDPTERWHDITGSRSTCRYEQPSRGHDQTQCG